MTASLDTVNAILKLTDGVDADIPGATAFGMGGDRS